MDSLGLVLPLVHHKTCSVGEGSDLKCLAPSDIISSLSDTRMGQLILEITDVSDFVLSPSPLSNKTVAFISLPDSCCPSDRTADVNTKLHRIELLM